MKRTIVAVFILSSLNNISAFPGYVSRDCGMVPAKESITVDWKSNERLFYTESFHLVTQNNNKIQRYYQSVACGGPNPCYVKGWRSYAGTIHLANMITHQGVTGAHYWRRGNKNDYRSSWTTTCNVESWGYDNWDN